MFRLRVEGICSQFWWEQNRGTDWLREELRLRLRLVKCIVYWLGLESITGGKLAGRLELGDGTGWRYNCIGWAERD